jgi:hypothetical protein
MDHVDTAALLIRLGVGICMILFGISQVKSPRNWFVYLPGPVRFILPTKPETFMRIHAIGNLVLGIILAANLWMPVTVWLNIFWWASILPFAFYKEMSTGLRDAAIIVSLIALLVLIQK